MKYEQTSLPQEEEQLETLEQIEELTPEKVRQFAKSKEAGLDGLGELSSKQTAALENSFTQSAQELGASSEEIGLASSQIEQIEQEKKQILEAAREKIGATEQEEKINTIADQLSRLSGEALINFVAEYNKDNPDSFKGQELSLMRADSDNVFFVNEQGSLEHITVTKENAGEVLALIKQKDEVLRGKSYELRRSLLERSVGSILTYEAYTYGELPRGNELDAFLDDPANWMAERKALHEQIIADEYEKAVALSDRLADPEPTIYALRGNTAAGKTTAVRNNELFAKAIDENGQPSGAINPDTYKTGLKSADASEGRQTIGHPQAHEEGSMLARKVSEKITKSDSSMVIDKRMNKEKNITELIRTAEENGKKIKILDVDVPFEVSLVRVLGRPVGGEDPIPPFNAVTEGFEGVRKNRLSLLEQVVNDPKIKDYVLMVADENGNSVKVAEKIDGKLVVLEGREEAYLRATDPNTENSVAEMSGTVIDETYITKIVERTPESMKSKVQASLDKYKGKTLKGALDEHASKLNPE